MRALAALCVLVLLVGGCVRIERVRAPGDATYSPDLAVVLPDPVPSAAPSLAPATAAGAADAAHPPKKLRVFVTAEGPYSGGTGEVYVLESSGGPFEVVQRIPLGGWPHQISVSPDRKWVAVNDRSSNQTSIIDPLTMKEVQRIPVGRTPHGITWSSDSRFIFIAHERDPFIGKIEVGSWRMTPLMVGVPQHVTVSWPGTPNELWFTVTNSHEPDHLRMYDLATGSITKVPVQDVHDAWFSPDGSEIWSSSGGFLDKPTDRLVIYDPATRTVKQELRLPGTYPFHSMKVNRDGAYLLPDPAMMVISSHYGPKGPCLLWLDWRSRTVVARTDGLGRWVFHETYDPIGDRLLVTSNVDGMVNVIDVRTKQVIQKVGVPKAHGLVAIGID